MSSSDVVNLELDASNRATIYYHGATVTSWIHNNKEVLFVSKNSAFDLVKAIRGGIPVVFPNFGPWDNSRPQHGFARIKKWRVKNPVAKTSDSVSVSLSLMDDEDTRKLWDHSFELVYHIELAKDKLSTRLEIRNTGQSEFEFTSLLHTYFGVDAIEKVKVYDLNDIEFIDKMQGANKFKETREAITIDQETDRIYVSTKSTHRLDTGSGVLKLEKENLPDSVLWNPWIAKSKAMADFGDDEYKKMVCLEAGYVSQKYKLKPNETVTMGQKIYV